MTRWPPTSAIGGHTPGANRPRNPEYQFFVRGPSSTCFRPSLATRTRPSFPSTRQSARIIAFHSASPRRDCGMSSSIPKSVTASTRTGTISVTTRTTAPTSTPATSRMQTKWNCLYVDECGTCGGTGIPEGEWFVADGNQLDALGICWIGSVARTQMAMGPVTTAKSIRLHGSRGSNFDATRHRTMEAVNSRDARIPKHRISIRMPMWMTAVAPIQVARIRRLGITMPRPTWTTAVASPMPVAWMENWSSPLIMLTPSSPCPFRQEARWFGKMSPPRSTM